MQYDAVRSSESFANVACRQVREHQWWNKHEQTVGTDWNLLYCSWLLALLGIRFVANQVTKDLEMIDTEPFVRLCVVCHWRTSIGTSGLGTMNMNTNWLRQRSGRYKTANLEGSIYTRHGESKGTSHFPYIEGDEVESMKKGRQNGWEPVDEQAIAHQSKQLLIMVQHHCMYMYVSPGIHEQLLLVLKTLEMLKHLPSLNFMRRWGPVLVSAIFRYMEPLLIFYVYVRYIRLR